MVVTAAIEIASAAASVASGLLIHYFRIAVAANSSAIIVDFRLWLRWWIVNPRHSRNIVIGIDAPVTSVAIGSAKRMLIAISNPASNWTSAPCYRPTDHRRWFVTISSRVTINKSLVCRRNRRMESRRRIHQPRPAIPSVPAARSPAPAASIHKHPAAIAIRHPAPRIS